jgi:NAD(P)-dependent dehydrogenase (short-subunit alcohol dehydrogenase family)
VQGRLDGRVAVVTGGASGYGHAVVTRFLAEGARVAVVDVAPGLEAVAKELGPPDRVVAVRADVSDEAALGAAFDTALDTFGGLDIAVNNAGVLGGGWIHEDGATDHLRRQLEVNVVGVWNGCRAAIRSMRARGTGGVLLVTGSTAAILPNPASPAYGLCKAAVVHLTRSLAFAYGRQGIRVNAVLPGPALTGIFGLEGEALAELEQRYLPNISLGRLGETAEVAAAMAYLASDEASFVTGAVLTVDGGFQPRPVMDPPPVTDAG